ncbi:uncharacterized protein CANTADRAFT_7611 [Suhomyces tanzawaensis NRRL Y-17324]|uniref:Uncharacterized protein n=1 Tax=Suhomyces tanzawaensis NRRL Y-17324 TaxID=984487 RepID=A0A1E4SF55_9ASCO|nr:uncharacterized protein CANTADRAFT_7611 [Suhomyces tanzawaensis NRRL Y-17324]ODV78159.1 hypothetical protein CANTADRAFT_7611 [Suhomyces tanzawaensis NRRL Y-17324]
MFSRHIRPAPRLARTLAKITFPEAQAQPKPKLSEFKNPLLHTFLVASSTCLVLHAVWLRLEYEVEEKKLAEKTKQLEDSIQDLLDEKRVEIERSNKRWYHYLWK